LSESDLKALGHHAQELGIELEAGTRGIDPAHLQNYLRVTLALGARLLRVVIDTPQHQPSPQETLEILAPMMEYFERSGVTLALENHDRYKSPALLDIVKRLNSRRIGICLDTANSFGSAEGPDQVLEVLGPFVACVHLKDFQVFRVPTKMGYIIEGRPAGQGQVDIDHWLRRLKDFGVDPNIIVELWPPPEPTIEETIAREDSWAQQSVAALRKFVTE
jgi:sugar phosphate isomerase/epimerase